VVASEDTAWTAGDVSSEEGRFVASTQYGPVRGDEEGGILVFEGVRYGADTATTRFAPPAPPEPWSEVRDALNYWPRAT
jgi:para-nitrobenzyl esterase